MNAKNYFLIVFLLKANFLIFGQRTETALNLTQEKSRLILEVENDMLFTTDNYYTAGIALSYTNNTYKKTPAQLILKSKNENHLNFSGVSFQQRIFTPYSIAEPNKIDNDRPYSAYLMASNFSVLINMNKKLKLSNEFGVGIMGPAAGGEQVQTFVHQIIGSVIPIGWENQLGNSLLIDYQFRVEKGFFKEWVADHIIPFAATRVGTLTDKVQVGLMTKFGNKDKFFKNISSPQKLNKQLIWEWVFESNLQGVFYDATLEGGLFKEDDEVALEKQEIISRQYQLRMGVNFYYKKLSFRYMVKFNSTDFTNAIVHRYASLNIGLAF